MYAIIEGGIVTNVVEWDGNTQTWMPPDGADVVKVPDGQSPQIGLGYQNGVFEQPPGVTHSS